MRAFFKGFAYAGRGLVAVVKSERNMRFHLCAAGYVLAFSLFYPFGAAEYAVLMLAIAMVLVLEAVNSALERLVDMLSPGFSEKAGLAKDMAAAAVLVGSIGAAVCGVFLFWNVAVFGAICRWFLEKPLWLLLFGASLVGSGLFVFLPGRTSKNAGDSRMKDGK